MGKADGRATLRDIFALVRDSKLSPEEKTLWLLYRSYETSGRGAYVNDEILAEHMGKGLRSVQRYRSNLIAAGYLEQEFRGRNGTDHRAVLPAETSPRTATNTGGQGTGNVANDGEESPPEMSPPVAKNAETSPQTSPETSPQTSPPVANTPTPPNRDEYGSTGVRESLPEGEADASAPESDAGDDMTANEVVAEWISRQPARPPSKAISKQGAAAKRLVRDYARDELTQALDGMSRLFPHSDGEPFDLFDLERKFAKALAAPARNGSSRQGGRPTEIDHDDLAAWGTP